MNYPAQLPGLVMILVAGSISTGRAKNPPAPWSPTDAAIIYPCR
ncbi:hypothetical protein [Ancylothrix sp. D3o]|nr:hypothetical protein [Ancylothrix sp. D3o]